MTATLAQASYPRLACWLLQGDVQQMLALDAPNWLPPWDDRPHWLALRQFRQQWQAWLPVCAPSLEEVLPLGQHVLTA